jgi:hypothetical protein
MTFGASTQDLAGFSGWAPVHVIENLLNYEQETEDVDANIGKPEYL